jgi:hypothetical protein
VEHAKFLDPQKALTAIYATIVSYNLTITAFGLVPASEKGITLTF